MIPTSLYLSIEILFNEIETAKDILYVYIGKRSKNNNPEKLIPVYPRKKSKPHFFIGLFFEYYLDEITAITEQNLKNAKKVPLTGKFVVLYMRIQTDNEYNPRKKG